MIYGRSEGSLGIVAAQGAWTDGDTFRIYLKMVRDVIECRIDVSFAQELVEIITYRIDDGLARQEFEAVMDLAIGPEWRRLREQPEIAQDIPQDVDSLDAWFLR